VIFKKGGEDKMSFENQLKEYAYKIGIDLIGITSAKPFKAAYRRLKEMESKHYLSPWIEPDLYKRCHPSRLMEDGRSLIAVGISYLTADQEEEKSNLPLFRGRLARFAQYQDYHQLLDEKMRELVLFIRKSYPKAKAEIYVDTGPLIDREVAYRAGLGFFGKNAALIHPEYGSFIAIGEILTDISLLSDQPLNDGCGECTLCIQACPAQAIKAPGEIQASECLSHFTQEKGLLDCEIREKIGDRLWGCDTCQDVCPYNQKARKAKGLFKVHALGKRPDLEQILQLSNKEYKNKVQKTSMAWRGKRTLQRNALINIGNTRNRSAIPILKKALTDQRPVIRGTACWALGQIRGDKAKILLEDMLYRETDVEVREVIKKSINKLNTSGR